MSSGLRQQGFRGQLLSSVPLHTLILPYALEDMIKKFDLPADIFDK